MPAGFQLTIIHIYELRSLLFCSPLSVLAQDDTYTMWR